SATDSGIRRGEVVVARISGFDDAGALIGLDVSVHAITLEWRDVPTLHPRTFRVRRHLPSLELAQLRTRLRTLEAPCLVRPSLLRRLLTDEAREVGSRLSELDHGGGAAAWERIAKAGAIARAAITALPEVRAASGLADLDAFASNPSSGWSALDRPAPLEPAPHIDACSVLALAARAPELARALAATALASLPRDHPLVGPLSALRDTGDEASLHRIAETVDPPRRGEGLHVGRRLADPV
ncbi:MAG: hypothetical protein K1X94_29795, partial [Sandaracinaceae bacterium]|nr:hypothetical protein [Sandaracinaceae bacterium]